MIGASLAFDAGEDLTSVDWRRSEDEEIGEGFEARLPPDASGEAGVA